jgi:large exoprotein involved in heme utilization and adhesion
VSGSFHVSTADYLRMSDGARFYADLGKQSTLSTAPVAAFGFLSTNPGPISIQGSSLKVPEGQTLSIIGGDINITGGSIKAPSGRINIASVASPGEVIPVESRNAPDLRVSSFDRLGSTNIQNSAGLDVSSLIGSSSGNGTVVIRGGKLLIENSSVKATNWGDIDGAKVGIDIGIEGDFVVDGGIIRTDTWGTGRGGDVAIRSGSMEMKNSRIEAYADGKGNGGNVEVSTGNLDMREGSHIGTDTFDGNAGNVTVTAESILMTGAYDPSGKLTYLNSGSEGPGRGGDIDISVKTGSLEVRDGAAIFASTGGSGAGGNVKINADSILISGRSANGRNSHIFTQSVGSGNAGDIDINTRNLEVQNGSISSASFFSGGKPGDLEVKADRILLTEGAWMGGGGFNQNTGNIGIETRSLEVTSGAFITAYGVSMAAGNIEVKADSILLSGVDTAISSSTFSPGAGGNILINARSLEVKEGATISAATFGPGNGGKIEVNAESVLVSGTQEGYASSLYTDSLSGATGNAGDIQITAQKTLEVKDGGNITASTAGSGSAGNISLTAPSITMTNGGGIGAETLGSGAGGSIQLSGNLIQLFNDAYIAAFNYKGTGNAGDIKIETKDTLLMKNSYILTSATQADGGNIHIKAGHMVELIDSEITASVKGGPQTVGGNITIDPEYVVLNDSQIIANAYEGKGGNIRIIADVFLASPDSIVDASSRLGIDGTVDIRAPITNISGTLAPMQGNFLSAESLLRDRCIARIRGEKYSSFVVSGRDGLPIRPDSVLPSPIY